MNPLNKAHVPLTKKALRQRRAQIAINAIENCVGHETAHLDEAEQVFVYKSLIESWTTTIQEIRAGLAHQPGASRDA